MRQSGNRVAIWATVGVMVVAGMLAAVSAGAATPPQMFPPVMANQSTRFTGSGFDANETLAFWVTAPDRTVTPLAGDRTDGSGAFSIPVSFASDGFWQVTAHSINTGTEVIGGFTVGNTAGATPVGTVVAPASATAIATSQAILLSRDGFRPLERASLWTTAPDGKVTPLDGVNASVSGTVMVSVSFPSLGFWQVTAHGIDSGKEVITGYNVGDTTVPAANTITATPTYMIGDPPLPGTRTVSVPFPGPNIVLQPTPTTNPFPGAVTLPTASVVVPTVTPVAGTPGIGVSEPRPTSRVIVAAPISTGR